MENHVDECLAAQATAIPTNQHAAGETSSGVSEPSAVGGIPTTVPTLPNPDATQSAAPTAVAFPPTVAVTTTSTAAIAPPSSSPAAADSSVGAIHLSAVHAAAGDLLESDPPPTDATLDTLLKLLRNVKADPANQKFRRVRLGNPKVQQAVVAVKGGLELLHAVGFDIR